MTTLDLNFDGQVTITDMWLLAERIACYPGNALIDFLVGTPIGDFLELTVFDGFGAFAWVVSVMAWLALLFLVLGLIDQRTDIAK